MPMSLEELELEVHLIKRKNDELLNYVHLAKYAAGAILSMFIGFAVFFNFKTLPDWHKDIKDSAKSQFDEYMRKYGPRELGNSAGTTALYYLLSSYINDFDKKNSLNRYQALLDIDLQLDTNSFLGQEIRRYVQDNQAIFYQFIPLLCNDLQSDPKIKENGHVGFWVILKFLQNSSGFPKFESVRFFETKFEGKDKLTIIFESVSKQITPQKKDELTDAYNLIRDEIDAIKTKGRTSQ